MQTQQGPWSGGETCHLRNGHGFSTRKEGRERERERKKGGRVKVCIERPHREERESTTVGRTLAARVNLRFLGVGRRERGSILCLTDSFP